MADTHLVTGAGGFVGANLVRRLLGDGHAVIAMLRPGGDRWRLRGVEDDPSLTILEAEIGSVDPKQVAGSLSGLLDGRAIGVVYHLAAGGLRGPADVPALIDANIAGTWNAVQLASQSGARRFIYCGSSSEYGTAFQAKETAPIQPNGYYAASKSAGWTLAECHGRLTGLETVCLRLYLVYGPFEDRQRLIPTTILASLDGAEIPLTGGEQTRDFIHVDDAVDAFVTAAAAEGVTGEVFNICTGVETSVRTLVEEIVDLCGGTARPQFGAMPYRPTEEWRMAGDPGKARTVLNWQPGRSLRSGLEATVTWMKAHRQLYS